MDKTMPEYYGYVIGQNIAPFVNKCIEAASLCHISEGTHIVGRNDKNFWTGNVYTDNIILWGWTAIKDGVQIIGAGAGKTILKFADNVQSRYLFNQDADYVMMLQTNYNVSCNNTVIQGITWDGNYANNSMSSTINCIRIRGENTTVKDCEFINFGVGNAQKFECYELTLNPINLAGKGPTITNCLFRQPGRKSFSNAGFVPEHTLIAAGGTNVLVDSNNFTDWDFNVNTQQSPLHAITLSNTTNALVNNNKFRNYQGACVYMDTARCDGTLITNNDCRNVWLFTQLTSQYYADTTQISLFTNISAYNNYVELSDGLSFYEWDKPGASTAFVGYVFDPNIDRTKFKGFINNVFKNNTVVLGNYTDNNGKKKYSDKLVCYWGNPVDSTGISVETNKFLVNLDKVILPDPVVVTKPIDTTAIQTALTDLQTIVNQTIQSTTSTLASLSSAINTKVTSVASSVNALKQ